jgi:hypothetical protein
LLLISFAVREADRLVAMPLVKAPRSRIGLKAIKANGWRKAGMGDAEQLPPDPLPCVARPQVELVDRRSGLTTRNRENGHDMIFVLSYVETSTWDKDIRDPFPGFLFRVGHGSERKVLAPGFAKYFGTS